jgi:hypothetical protein
MSGDFFFKAIWTSIDSGETWRELAPPARESAVDLPSTDPFLYISESILSNSSQIIQLSAAANVRDQKIDQLLADQQINRLLAEALVNQQAEEIQQLREAISSLTQVLHVPPAQVDHLYRLLGFSAGQQVSSTLGELLLNTPNLSLVRNGGGDRD